MLVGQVLSLLAAFLMFAFGAIVLQRYHRKRQIFNLFWGIGLLMFGVGAFAEGYLFSTWSEPIFRAWYAFGAMLNAGWLGHGSLTLLVRRPWVRVLTIGIVALSLIGIIAVFAIPLNSSAYTSGVPVSDQYKSILPPGAPVRLADAALQRLRHDLPGRRRRLLRGTVQSQAGACQPGGGQSC